MLQVGVIGCGNAGNQTVSAMAAKYRDIPVLAINCSERDLSTVSKDILQKVVGDGKGAGKNRTESKKFLAQSISDLVSDKDVSAFMHGLDIVFIVSSTGGGTGSGMSLLLSKVLSKGFPEVFPIPVGILPSVNEALSTQTNTIEYLNELYTLLDNPTYMLYDNEKGTCVGMSTSKMMEAVNNQIVEDINILRGYYNTVTKYTSIDDKDAKVLITTPGRLVVASLFNLVEQSLQNRSIDDRLCDFIKAEGFHAPVQRDKIVKRTGVIVNMTADLLNEFDSSLSKKVQGFIGIAVEGFEHLAETENRKLPNNVFLILAGLTKINDRIAIINERIKEITDAQNQSEDDDEMDMSLVEAVAAKKEYRSQTARSEQKTDVGGIFAEFGIDVDNL